MSTPPTSAAYPAPRPSSSTAAGITAATTSPHSPPPSGPLRPQPPPPRAPGHHDRPDGNLAPGQRTVTILHRRGLVHVRVLSSRLSHDHDTRQCLQTGF